MPRPARLLKLRIIVGVLCLTGCASKKEASVDTPSVGWPPSPPMDTGFSRKDSERLELPPPAMEIPPIHDPRDTIRTTKDSLKGDSLRKE